MIQNILTFCVKNDLTYVSGSIPSGKLVANDINRNSIYLITPYDEAIVKANFQTNLQSDTPTSVLGILVNGEIEVGELVDTNASYYNLVKDWNIYEFKVPSTTLSFISRNRTGKIGINFSIEQRLVPMIKVSYGTYKGEITELAQTPTENGYYIIKALGYEYEDSVELKSFDLNDILVYNATTDVATKISAYSNRGSTPTAMYSVDPSLLNDNFETIDSGLTAQIVQQVNDNTSDILLILQAIGVSDATLLDFSNRISVAESDIDKIEDGTTVVGKALRDSLGNVIKDSYVSAVYPTYNNTTDKLFIETYSVEDGLLANNEVVLPKATTSKNGLMAKEHVNDIADIKANKADKTYVDSQDQILDDRIDTIIAGTVDGVSGAEIVDARKGFPILGDKIDTIDDTIEQHEYYKVFRNNKIVPCVTFIDDDGSSQVYTALKPIFDSKNIKGNLSIIAGFLDTTNFLTRIQLDELYNDGWAILGHAYDVLTNLGDPLYANDNDLKYQIYDGCKLLLESYGYEVDGFVYPQSVSDFRIRNMTKLYYDYAFSKLGINDDTLMDTMQIRRISIGSLDNPTINGNSDSNTLDYYKACVDYAVANNSWIAFTTHIATTNATQRQHLADLIDYIKSLNVLITDTKTAHKIHSNKVFTGDVEGGTYTIISKNGKLYDSNQIFYSLELNAYASTTLIEEYPYGISVFYVNSFGNSGYPKNASGIVQTYKVGALSGYYYQEFKRYLSPEKFIRYVNFDGSWSIWEEITDIRVLESNKYNLTNVPNDFRLGVTSCTVSNSNTSWGTSPFIALGTLVNYKLSTSGNETYQEYFVRGQSVNWRRVWNPVTAQWGAWFQLVGHSGTTSNRPTTVNIGYSYFDTTLGKPIWWKGTVWVDATGTTV